MTPSVLSFPFTITIWLLSPTFFECSSEVLDLCWTPKNIVVSQKTLNERGKRHL